MDRTIRGLVAGIIASIIQNTWNLIDYYFFHITKLRFLDWVSVLISWERPENNFFAIFCLVLQILWDGFLGVIFVHLIGLITSKSLIIKSTIFGMILWFVFRVIVNLFRVPILSGIQHFPGGYSNFLAVVLWGITLGFILKKFEKLSKT